MMAKIVFSIQKDSPVLGGIGRNHAFIRQFGIIVNWNNFPCK